MSTNPFLDFKLLSLNSLNSLILELLEILELQLKSLILFLLVVAKVISEKSLNLTTSISLKSSNLLFKSLNFLVEFSSSVKSLYSI